MKAVFSAAILICALVLLSGCSSRHQWNQKLTVVVQTPQGERSGFSVVHMSVSVGRQFMTSTIKQYSLEGEATVIEITPGKYLFALLAHAGENSTNYLAETIWRDLLPKYKGDEEGQLREFYSAIASTREIRDVPSRKYPLLVTFTDINDPKSVKEVKPFDLAATFGPGYNLKSITLEITDEPVTEGNVVNIVSWLPKIEGRIKPTNKKYERDLTPEEKLYSNAFVVE